jgi:hypothetical protein
VNEVYVCDSRRIGLILYNPHDREGSKEEADDLKVGLEAAGCDITKKEWSSKADIRKLIDEGVDSSAGCSLLITCIMSHGCAGKLKTSDGEIIINDILVQINKKLDKKTPMVSKSLD